MSGFLSGSQFGRKFAIRVGIFLTLTLGFPFIVYGLVVATGANRIGGAGGALAVVAGIYLKPVIIVAFLLSLILPCWRRMRSLGLPAYWGLIVPILFAADATYFMVLGAHWGVSFSLGIWRVNAPLFAISALFIGIAMAYAVSPSNDEPSGLGRFGRAGVVTAWLAIALLVVSLCLWVMGVWNFSIIWSMSSLPKGAPPFSPLYLAVSKVAGWLHMIKPFVCLALSGMVVWLTVVSRRSGGDGEISNPPGAGPSTVLASPNAPRTTFGRR